MLLQRRCKNIVERLNQWRKSSFNFAFEAISIICFSQSHLPANFLSSYLWPPSPSQTEPSCAYSCVHPFGEDELGIIGSALPDIPVSLQNKHFQNKWTNCQSLRKDDLKILLSVNIFENLYAVKEVKLGILVVPDYAIFNEELEWEGTGATMGGSKHCLSPAPEGQMRPPARQRLTLGPSYLSWEGPSI